MRDLVMGASRHRGTGHDSRLRRYAPPIVGTNQPLARRRGASTARPNGYLTMRWRLVRFAGSTTLFVNGDPRRRVDRRSDAGRVVRTRNVGLSAGFGDGRSARSYFKMLTARAMTKATVASEISDWPAMVSLAS